jgi:hypothetical protein
VPVRVRCEWPADLEKAGLVVYMPLRSSGLTKERFTWNLGSGMGTTIHALLLGPGKTVTEVVSPAGFHLWATSGPRADVLSSNLRILSNPAESLAWERGRYRPAELIVMRRLNASRVEPGRERFEIVVRCYPEHSSLPSTAYEFRQAPPSESDMKGGRHVRMTGGGTQIAFEGLQLSVASWSRTTKQFVAGPDRVNDWTVTLPEELINAVRQKLETDKNDNAE